MSSAHSAEPGPGDGRPPADPPVKHETHDANLTTIVFVGCVLVASAVVIHVGVWGLFHYFTDRDNRLKASEVPLVRGEMNQLPQQPRLEAFRPTHAGVELETAEGRRYFYVDGDITVVRQPHREGEPSLTLYDLRPGDEVSLTYQRPPGLSGGDGVTPEENQVGRERAVRIEIGPGRARPGRSVETGLITAAGRLVHIDPVSGPDKRAAAEARLRHYGWVDEKKQIAHIPIDRAMDILVEGHLLKSEPVKEEGKVRPENAESSSGRTPEEGKK